MLIGNSLKCVTLLYLALLPNLGNGQQVTPEQLYKRGKRLVEMNWRDSYGPSKDELLSGVAHLQQAVDGGYSANGKAFWYMAGGYETLADLFATDESQKKAYFEKAKDAYRKLIAMTPTETEPRMNLAQLLENEGAVDAAQDQYLEVFKIRPNHPLAHFSIGFIVLKKNDTLNAVTHFKAAVQSMDAGMLRDIGVNMVDALKKHGLTTEASQLRAAIDSRLNSQ